MLVGSVAEFHLAFRSKVRKSTVTVFVGRILDIFYEYDDLRAKISDS